MKEAFNMTEQETIVNVENISQYIKPKRGYLYYISMLFIVLAIALSIKNIYLTINGKYSSDEYFSITYMIFGMKTIDLLIPFSLTIGGIFLAIDVRRNKRKFKKNSSYLKQLSIKSILAYISIFIGAGIISVIAVKVFLFYLAIALIFSGM